MLGPPVGPWPLLQCPVVSIHLPRLLWLLLLLLLVLWVL
jgi:hypothetical protein